MSSRRRWLHLLGTGLLAGALLGQAGCLSCCHPIDQPAPEQVTACHTVPACCRSHVYVFLVDGLDPVRFCNFAGVHDYLIQLGFIKTYHGELYHCFWFNSEIHQIHKEDPDARFVIVGHGAGAKMARSMAQDLQAESIPVHLLVYVDGSMMNGHEPRPGNVERVINAHVSGYVWSSKPVADADNVYLDGASTFSAATDRQTLDLLSHELMQLAMTVPMRVTEPAPPLPETGPTPRPVERSTTAARDDWDFLKPNSQLSSDVPFRYPRAAAEASETPKTHTSLKPTQSK